MNRSLTVAIALLASALALTGACSSSSVPSFTNGSDGGASGSGSGGGTGSTGSSGGAPNLGGGSADDSGTGGSGILPDGGIACPAGLTCNVSCAGGATTSITGKVYDPAMKNPLYNVAVYVPAVPLVALPKGVPTGADACSCGALFQSGALANTTTAVDGSFTLQNVPVGDAVPLVIQIGKWRRLYTVKVTACTANAQANMGFLGTIAAGDTNDNIPDIAVSTGYADTLECLMLRIGIAPGEYVPGSSTTGHIHIFNGGVAEAIPTPGAGGIAELNPMVGAPTSSTSLWDSQTDLMPYDIVLLSCEGDEAYDANPANLELYLNAGGRAFASHYHYSWFSGPIDGTSGQTYTAPADWGSNLATWSDGTGATQANGSIVTTLNGSGKPFSKGTTLAAWLAETGALGQNGAPAGELSIYQARYNAAVTATNTPSQPWITANTTSTMYFSFDTPVDAPVGDSGVPNYCGRAVFSDLHVSGDPSETDTENVPGGSPPPTGCDNTSLSPQEKALEFMLFDLSSCVIPDTVAVPVDAGLPPPPQAK